MTPKSTSSSSPSFHSIRPVPSESSPVPFPFFSFPKSYCPISLAVFVVPPQPSATSTRAPSAPSAAPPTPASFMPTPAPSSASPPISPLPRLSPLLPSLTFSSSSPTAPTPPAPPPSSTFSGLWPSSSFASDGVVAILDTGIFPSHPSFLDSSLSPPLSSWRGSCDSGFAFNSFDAYN